MFHSITSIPPRLRAACSSAPSFCAVCRVDLCECDQLWTRFVRLGCSVLAVYDSVALKRILWIREKLRELLRTRRSALESKLALEDIALEPIDTPVREFSAPAFTVRAPAVCALVA